MELSPNETITSALLSKVADLETRVLSPEKKYRDERRARITLETSFRTVKAKSKQWAGAMGVRLRMLENRGKPVLTLLNTQREERRIHKSKRKKMKAAIKGLKNKVMKLEAANIDDEDKTHAVVGMKSGAKRIKNIIREQGRHYRMISEVSPDDGEYGIPYD